MQLVILLTAISSDKGGAEAAGKIYFYPEWITAESLCEQLWLEQKIKNMQKKAERVKLIAEPKS